MKKLLVTTALIMAATASIGQQLKTNSSSQTSPSKAKRGGVCGGPFIGGVSVLQCEHIGNATIAQIYEKGFRVVHMQDQKAGANYVTLVIEEQ